MAQRHREDEKRDKDRKFGHRDTECGARLVAPQGGLGDLPPMATVRGDTPLKPPVILRIARILSPCLRVKIVYQAVCQASWRW